MSFTEKSIRAELARIQANVPSKIREGLFKTVKKTPQAEFVVRETLKDPNLDPKKRAELELLLNTGEFSKTEQVVDEAVAKRLDRYVGFQIDKAVREKRLPNKKQLSKLMKYASKETPETK